MEDRERHSRIKAIQAPSATDPRALRLAILAAGWLA